MQSCLRALPRPGRSPQRLLEAHDDLQVRDHSGDHLADHSSGHDRPRQFVQGVVDGSRAPQSNAGPSVELAALAGPAPPPFQLLGVAIADRLPFHRRRLALLAVGAEVLAASIVGITLTQPRANRAVRGRRLGLGQGFSRVNLIHFQRVTHPGIVPS